MTFTYNPTFKQQYVALLALQFRSPLLIAVNMLFPVAGAALILILVIKLHRMPSAYETSLIFACIDFTPLLNAILLFLARRKNPTVLGIQSVTVGALGLDFSGTGFQTHLDWGAIYKVQETKRFFLFFLSPRLVQFLPKDAVQTLEDRCNLRNALRRYTGGKAHLLSEKAARRGHLAYNTRRFPRDEL